MRKKRLMIPGPTDVSSQALEQLSLPIQPHYGNEWMEIYNGTLVKLKKIFVTKNDIVIYAATASAAIESAISSILEPDDNVLICHNGYFSERLIEIIKSWGGVPILVKSEFNQSVDPSVVSEVLEQNKKIKLIAMVHVETSTGVENPVKDICKIAKKHNIITLVDAVSSLGGCELKVDHWGIDFAVTGSQKCLESPAGLSFLSISTNAWQIIASKKTAISGWYLNLINIKKYQEKWAHFLHSHGPTTAPVSLYMALNCSLDKIIEEGLNERIKRHKKMSVAVRKTLETLGVKLFVSDKSACTTLTSFLLPEMINPGEFLKLIRDEYDILLSGDLGYVNNQLIRFGHMGMSASIDYLSPTFEALEKSLDRLGFQFNKTGALKIFNDLIN